ncbi:MAG: hypothetical protein V1903_09735 [Bacteroidota bacterium]
MRINTFYIRYISLVILVSAFTIQGLSQGIDIREKRLPKFYLGLSGSWAQTMIVNDAENIDVNIESTRKTCYFYSFEIGTFPSRHFGITTGVIFSPYATDLTINSYNDVQNNVRDSEGDTYTRYIEGTNIIETQEIDFIKIPFFINIYTGKAFGIHFQAGMNMSIPMNQGYSTTGTFSYTGYYSEYDVTIFNVGHEDFLDNTKVTTQKELLLNKYNPELVGAVGFHFVIANTAQLSFSGFYNKMLKSMSEYSSSSNFILSSSKTQGINSIMSGSKESMTEAFGAKITLRFFIGSKK